MGKKFIEHDAITKGGIPQDTRKCESLSEGDTVTASYGIAELAL